MPPIYNQQLVALVLLIITACCHATITYPGWRGDNLPTVNPVQENVYPCGGLPETTNRTLWPVTGGAVAFRPRWPGGHENELVSVNMGLGPAPQNYSLPLVSRVEIAGPAAAADPQRPGTVCLPYVPVSGGYGVRVGDAATIQVVERADNEASVYSCVDIIFADQADVAGPDQTNCFNSTSITFVSSSTSDATSSTGDMWGIGTSSGSRARIFASKTGSTTATLTSTSTPAQTNIATGTTGRDAFPDSLLLVGLLVALCWRLYV